MATSSLGRQEGLDSGKRKAQDAIHRMYVFPLYFRGWNVVFVFLGCCSPWGFAASEVTNNYFLIKSEREFKAEFGGAIWDGAYSIWLGTAVLQLLHRVQGHLGFEEQKNTTILSGSPGQV